MAIIKEDVTMTQDESISILMQALGVLLVDFQKARKVDHLSFNFMEFTWKVGVDENNQIQLEKHELETPQEIKKKLDLVSVEDFKKGL